MGDDAKAAKAEKKAKEEAEKKRVEEEKKLLNWVLSWKYLKTVSNKFCPVIKFGPLKMQGKKTSSSFDRHWFGVISNFMIWYPVSSEPAIRTDEAWYKGFIRLEFSDPSGIQSLGQDKFQIPHKDRTYFFQAIKDGPSCDEWVNALKPHCQTIVNAHNAVQDQHLPFDQAQETFPVGFDPQLPPLVQGADFAPFVEQLRVWEEECKKWDKFFPNTKPLIEISYVHATWLDFFFGEGGGAKPVRRKLAQLEDQAQNVWTKKVNDINSEVQVAFEQRFFKEDLEDILKKSQFAFHLIDQMNKLMDIVLHEPGEYLKEQQTTIKAYSTLFSKLPHSKEINFDKYVGGVVVTPEQNPGDQKWVYTKEADGGKLECTSHPLETAPFEIKGCQQFSMTHGVIIWNKVSWVWFHPRIRFTIRYNLRAGARTFSYYPGKADALPGQVTLPDWKFDDVGLFTPESRSTDTKMKGMIPRKIGGSVPLPVALIVCLHNHLLDIVKELLGVIPGKKLLTNTNNDQAHDSALFVIALERVISLLSDPNSHVVINTSRFPFSC